MALASIKDIKVDIPEGENSPWKIERFTVTDEDVKLHNMRCSFQPGMGNRYMVAGTYTRLMRGGTLVMSDTRAEIMDHFDFIRHAKGRVLINGLGMGWVVEALFQKPEVEDIIVVEISPELIELVGPHYFDKLPEGKLFSIVNADALEYKPEKGVRFDAVWHDIWDHICADNLEDMKKLHRKYGRRTDWQGSWCRYLCEMNRGY